MCGVRQSVLNPMQRVICAVVKYLTSLKDLVNRLLAILMVGKPSGEAVKSRCLKGFGVIVIELERDEVVKQKPTLHKLNYQ